MFLLIDIDVLGKKVSQNEIFFRNIKEILFWYRFVGHAQLNSLQRSDTQKIWGLKKLFKLKMCLSFRKSYEDQILS